MSFISVRHAARLCLLPISLWIVCLWAALGFGALPIWGCFFSWGDCIHHKVRGMALGMKRKELGNGWTVWIEFIHL